MILSYHSLLILLGLMRKITILPFWKFGLNSYDLSITSPFRMLRVVTAKQERKRFNWSNFWYFFPNKSNKKNYISNWAEPGVIVITAISEPSFQRIIPVRGEWRSTPIPGIPSLLPEPNSEFNLATLHHHDHVQKKNGHFRTTTTISLHLLHWNPWFLRLPRRIPSLSSSPFLQP